MNCELKKFRVTHSWLRLMNMSAVIEATHEEEAKRIADFIDDSAWIVEENDEWMTGSDQTEVEEVSDDDDEAKHFVPYVPAEDSDTEESGAYA
jgi:hypothetical protein